jgi:GntR family transcriptional regulator
VEKVTVDKSSIIPLYYQLADHLRDQIASNEIRSGELLPSEFELMKKLEISRGTVRQAIQMLELEGLVERYPGKGTFVSVPKIEQNANRQMGFFTKSMMEAGKVPSATVLEVDEISAPRNVQKILGLDHGDKIIAVRRLRRVNEEPWAIEVEFFRHDVGKNLMGKDLTGSIYEILQEEYSYLIHRSKNSIEAMVADKEQADLLSIKVGSPLLEVRRVVYLADGFPFEYSIDLLRADRIKFSVDDFYQEEKAQFKIKAEEGNVKRSYEFISSIK